MILAGTPEQYLERCRSIGVRHALVKLGSEGAKMLSDGIELRAIPLMSQRSIQPALEMPLMPVSLTLFFRNCRRNSGLSMDVSAARFRLAQSELWKHFPVATRSRRPARRTMSRKVAFLGGGGVRTPLVIFGINEASKHLDVEELVLYDVDRERVEMIAWLGREVVRRSGGSLRITVAQTPEQAVEGAAFVLNSVRVGGIATRAHDERAAIACGYPGQGDDRAGRSCHGSEDNPCRY